MVQSTNLTNLIDITIGVLFLLANFNITILQLNDKTLDLRIQYWYIQHHRTSFNILLSKTVIANFENSLKDKKFMDGFLH